MDPDQTRSSAPRKVRFPPKAPPRRNPKPPDPKTEVVDDARSHDEELLRRVNKHLGKQGPQVEKNSSVQVTFGAASSDSIRAYGRRGEGNTGRSKDSGLKDSDSGDEQIVFSLPSTAKPDGTTSSSANAVDASYQKKQKNYKEPWTQELLDEAEFGDAAINLEYDEKNVNPALELGLLEENNKPQMFFLQFPDNLPLVKQSASANGKERTDRSKPSGSTGASAGAKGKEIAGRSTVGDTSVKGKETVGSSMPLETSNASMMGCSLNELPGGYMGKMFVYKSGAIKWKLGEVIHDVSHERRLCNLQLPTTKTFILKNKRTIFMTSRAKPKPPGMKEIKIDFLKKAYNTSIKLCKIYRGLKLLYVIVPKGPPQSWGHLKGSAELPFSLYFTVIAVSFTLCLVGDLGRDLKKKRKKVSPGVSCKCFQDVVAINTADENCCALGEIGKRAVVTPDIDSLLDNVIELE
ncbi:unnamed protein product [Camellia sinensis]